MHVGILNAAIEAAKMGEHNYGFRVGAVIFKSKRILVSGSNKLRHCRYVDNKYKIWIDSLHAEQQALVISKLNILDVTNANILVVRLNKSNKLLMARPCALCLQMCHEYGIKFMYYSTTTGEIKREKVSEAIVNVVPLDQVWRSSKLCYM